ncbi:NYN domain-containing protein [Sphingomicrobium marinum]|uniref:NYN domain-containing protein n=1 Tax=Sphingomicrobium marinum TaxID=1227950 RepID=UPI002240A85B|nr:NYN domain-containing protein [Sphingomicrobium marinum]
MTDRNDPPERELNIALLIDADNASPDHLDEVLTVLAELGEINIRRIYGNWSKTQLKNWGTLTGRHSLVPVQQFDITKGKSATDMRMVIDAMDLLYRGNVEGFGIMSSDSDFLPLAQRIREDGLPVYGFGQDKTPVGFRQACTRFFDVDKLGNGKGNGGSDKGKNAGPRVDEELTELLGNAWKASKRDEEGYAALSEIGQRAKAVSSFAVRNYGYTRLSDLVSELDNFDVKKGDDNRLIVKRLR